MRLTKPPGFPRHLAAVGFAAALIFAAGAVGASPTFPGVLQEKLGMPCPPPCTLCHVTPTGGYLTATQPFGQAAIGSGAIGTHDDSLRQAIDTMESTTHPDSDSDGILDITELREGHNPNPNGGNLLCPEYGCSCGTTRSSTDSLAALLAAGVAASLVWNARRARCART